MSGFCMPNSMVPPLVEAFNYMSDLLSPHRTARRFWLDFFNQECISAAAFAKFTDQNFTGAVGNCHRRPQAAEIGQPALDLAPNRTPDRAVSVGERPQRLVAYDRPRGLCYNGRRLRRPLLIQRSD